MVEDVAAKEMLHELADRLRAIRTGSELVCSVENRRDYNHAELELLRSGDPVGAKNAWHMRTGK